MVIQLMLRADRFIRIVNSKFKKFSKYEAVSAVNFCGATDRNVQEANEPPPNERGTVLSRRGTLWSLDAHS